MEDFFWGNFDGILEDWGVPQLPGKAGKSPKNFKLKSNKSTPVKHQRSSRNSKRKRLVFVERHASFPIMRAYSMLFTIKVASFNTNLNCFGNCYNKFLARSFKKSLIRSLLFTITWQIEWNLKQRQYDRKPLPSSPTPDQLRKANRLKTPKKNQRKNYASYKKYLRKS